MAIRREILSALKSGITRLREKGGASKDTLYDLVNSYVTKEKTMRARYGSKVITNMLAGTKGLCWFEDAFHVFSNDDVTVPSGFVCNILIHPTDRELTIANVHFSAPFMREIYVVAEFSDGSIFHYWLQRPTVWTANTIMYPNWAVSPTVANGFAYRASRLSSPYPLWVKDIVRTVGDRIEPTIPNGFYYEVTSVSGDNPRSGATEPTWIASDGAQVIEDTALTIVPVITPDPDPPGTPNPGDGDGGYSPYDPPNPVDPGGIQQP